MRKWLLAVLLLAPFTGLAQDLARCASIETDTERLRCYDSISGRAAPTAAPAGAADAEVGPVSRWERRILDDATREVFTLTTLRPSYFMYTHLDEFNYAPYRFVDADDRLEEEEIKLHLSMQTKAADDLLGGNGDLWFGYTQTAYWQLFADEASSPFREAVHEPEAYLAFLTDYSLLGLTGRGYNVGVWHQSNGRGGSLSRSWNRVYAEFQFVRGNFALRVKPWLRIGDVDDNPDIEDYFGNYELAASWERRNHLFAATLRNAFDPHYGAELNWSFPIKGRLRGLVQWYYGYNENLIDHDHKNNRVGVGVLISDWL